jgi:hypothetical protein
LQKAVPGNFVFGICREGLEHELAEPSTDDKDANVKIVVFLFGKGDGVIEGWEGGNHFLRSHKT